MNTTAFQGTRVKLNCKAEGYPNNITYQWFHEDGNVHNSPGLMTRAGIFADGSFVITSVGREDIGWYRCQPSNGVGTPPEAQAFLNVTCESDDDVTATSFAQYKYAYKNYIDIFEFLQRPEQ